NGVSGTVAVQARQIPEETRFLLDLASECDIIKAVVGWVDLRSDNLPQLLKEYKGETKLKGFRHVLQGEEPEFMLQESFVRGLKTIYDQGYSYDILVFERHLPATLELVTRLPDDMPLIVDHIAKPNISEGAVEPWRKNIFKLATHQNVYCKVSGMVTEADWKNWTPQEFEVYLKTVFEAFGPQRILFGSDWPVCLVAGSYSQIKALVGDFVKTNYPEYKESIFSDNARRFYEL
ncbi:MAG: amidohydrolase family protein, partial [Lentisphaeraceae bacterium]|nr:amidohydrolase family protein [Lentisphaeraceae bacterium]